MYPESCHRAGSTATSSLFERQLLPSEQIDLWEHAALLYQSFEWQASVDAFRSLARIIDYPREKALCWYNVGLIQARLGDFEQALESCYTGLRTQSGNAVAFFLVGLIEWELRNYIKAEAAFLEALDKLQGFDHHFDEVRLDFTLEVHAVHYNIEACQYASDEGVYSILVTIPCELIFEPPLRPETTYARKLSISRTASMKSFPSVSRYSSLSDAEIGKQIVPAALPLRPKWRPLITPEVAERVAQSTLR